MIIFETKHLYDQITAELKQDPNNRKLKRQLPDKNLNLDELADVVGADRVLILKTDECASAFSLSGFEKRSTPQQAGLIMKGNFQGVYAENL